MSADMPGDYTVTILGPEYSMSVTVYADNPADALYKAISAREEELTGER